jgi:hypothetical protein
MIGISIENPGNRVVHATTHPSLFKGFEAVTNIIFAFGMTVFLMSISCSKLTFITAGHVAFFGFMSEMKEPASFPKSLYMLQIVDTALYVVAAVVIYYYGGEHVTSPALGSTGPTLRKIGYGIAAPTVSCIPSKLSIPLRV